ncbi:MAG: winged helix-turn-helix transcriptional regulator [Rhodobacteraceae bacterium]|nr:winged helix-turn-helix transcriptional regulator [Paracoccaceae bacterium]
MKARADTPDPEVPSPSSLPDDLFLVQVEHGDATPHTTLSFSRSPTVLLTFAANRFTRAASRLYQERYGIGAMDWRMLVMLTREPGATIARSSEVIGIDKAAVSRSVQRLRRLGLVSQGMLHANGRSRGLNLTPEGHDLHARILREALDRQKRLLGGFSPEEVTMLCDMLTRFLENLEGFQRN